MNIGVLMVGSPLLKASVWKRKRCVLARVLGSVGRGRTGTAHLADAFADVLDLSVVRDGLVELQLNMRNRFRLA